MTPQMLYWLLRLDSIKIFLRCSASISTILIIVLLICLLISAINEHCDREWTKTNPCTGNSKDLVRSKAILKIFRWKWIIGIPFALFFSLANVLIPTTKQMTIIYVVPKIVNNKQVQEIPKRLLNLTNDWLNELKPENIKKEEATEQD